ncbi:hypothetical protein [Cereibacter ovatus]|uniref:hypothetical protein n=1 Tax=Cereibacter ovatus TaxID=439529 RepID=UPI0019565EA8|nr:hypothetical protein [Cereibacter ovatus]
MSGHLWFPDLLCAFALGRAYAKDFTADSDDATKGEPPVPPVEVAGSAAAVVV